MKTPREEIIDWLNDAYSMERGLEVTLRKQGENDDVHRAIRERARIHLDETKTHAERVGQCLEMLGSSPSTVKSASGQMMEMAKGMTTMFARDERVKDYLASYGAEYFEVACYKALIAGAEATGEDEIVPLLTKNLNEDLAMARWLDDNVRAVVREYIGEKATANAA